MAMINRNQAPHYTTDFSIQAIQPELITLSNNIQLYCINAGSQELCKIELVFNAGNYYEPQALIASATNALMREGTSTKTAAQIAETLDFYGAFLETAVHKDQASVILYSLNKHLGSTLPLVLEVLQDAIFPEKEIDLYKTNQKQKFLVNQQKVDFVARNNFNLLLFEDTKYGQFIKAEDYDAIDANALKLFYSKQYTGNGMYIVASGKIDNQVKKIVSDCFESLQLKDELPAAAYTIKSVGRKEVFMERGDAMQSAIRIGRRLFNKKHHDYFGMQVLNTILGGYFGSRLMSNIREDKGYTYGIGSGVSSMLQDGFFYISTEVGVDVTKATLNEIYKELETLQQTEVPQEELALVKNYLLGTFLRSVDGPFAMSEKFTAIKNYGLTNDFYVAYVNYLKQVKAADLMLLAQKYLNKNELSELVVGKL